MFPFDDVIMCNTIMFIIEKLDFQSVRNAGVPRQLPCAIVEYRDLFIVYIQYNVFDELAT